VVFLKLITKHANIILNSRQNILIKIPMVLEDISVKNAKYGLGDKGIDPLIKKNTQYMQAPYMIH
jgi:hypothetical protein